MMSFQVLINRHKRISIRQVQARQSSVIAGAEERRAIAKANMRNKKAVAVARKLAIIEADEEEPEDDFND